MSGDAVLRTRLIPWTSNVLRVTVGGSGVLVATGAVGRGADKGAEAARATVGFGDGASGTVELALGDDERVGGSASVQVKAVNGEVVVYAFEFV